MPKNTWDQYLKKRFPKRNYKINVSCSGSKESVNKGKSLIPPKIFAFPPPPFTHFFGHITPASSLRIALSLKMH